MSAIINTDKVIKIKLTERGVVRMRVLVTGASGFIAANLLRRLLKDGHEVHCIVRKHSALWRLIDIQHRVVLHLADLSQPLEVDAVFSEVRPDWIFHLSTTRAEPHDFEGFFQGNIVSTANLISVCLKYPPARVVVYGSSLEYGHREQPLCEDMIATPRTWHGNTKLCSTQLFLQACTSYKLPVVVLRLFSIYGPWESSKRLLPKAILAGIDGRSIQLTQPGIRRDYVFVDDVIDASLIAVSKKNAIGEIINIGSGTQVSNEALCAEINKLTENKLHINSYAYPRHETDTNYWVADTRKCKSILNWSASTTLLNGLQITMEWLKQHHFINS